MRVTSEKYQNYGRSNFETHERDPKLNSTLPKHLKTMKDFRLQITLLRPGTGVAPRNSKDFRGLPMAGLSG